MLVIVISQVQIYEIFNKNHSLGALKFLSWIRTHSCSPPWLFMAGQTAVSQMDDGCLTNRATADCPCCPHLFRTRPSPFQDDCLPLQVLTIQPKDYGHKV